MPQRNITCPPIILEEAAQTLLSSYRWPGNIRQLKNLTDQISIIEKERQISAATLTKYLPAGAFSDLPVLYKGEEDNKITERELLYKVLFDMKRDMNDLKQLVMNILEGSDESHVHGENAKLIQRLYKDYDQTQEEPARILIHPGDKNNSEPVQEPEEIHETYSLEKKEIEYIRRALEKHDGKRKDAAQELGISERTLYRKIKEYNLE